MIVIQLVNGTGREITEFQVKDQDTDDYNDNMLADSWKTDEERTLYLDASQYKDGVKWNVRVGYGDGTASSITSYPFTEMASGTFHISDDGLLYVSFTNTATGEETDTLETERSYRNPDHQEPAEEETYNEEDYNEEDYNEEEYTEEYNEEEYYE